MYLSIFNQKMKIEGRHGLSLLQKSQHLKVIRSTKKKSSRIKGREYFSRSLRIKHYDKP